MLKRYHNMYDQVQTNWPQQSGKEEAVTTLARYSDTEVNIFSKLYGVETPFKKEDNVDQNLTAKVDQDLKQEMNKRQAERLLNEKLAIVDALGSDNFEDKTVIRFEKRFLGSPNSKEYTYVAIKIDDKWHLTGGQSNKTWEELVTFLVGGEFPTTSFTIMVPKQ